MSKTFSRVNAAGYMCKVGLINDMFTERENDDYEGWQEIAGQADFDSF